MAARSPASVGLVKLGGSVLTGPEAFARCAAWLRDRVTRDPAQRIVAVVSAELGLTDSLLAEACRLVLEPDPATLDLLWSTGELRSVALLTLNLHRVGVAAVGLSAHECGLVAPTGARAAAAIRVHTLKLRYWLTRHAVVVVPGFLARGPLDTLVTLGRGGSDLTAVLLAAALHAERCELIKDVPGYFSADPHRCAAARPLAELTYAEALAMAAAGCDLVQTAALEAAARTGTPLVIRSLAEDAPRTIVRDPDRPAKTGGPALRHAAS